MEKGFSSKKKNVLANQKEVFKDLEKLGRDSPESGSLYSDYESGQQYEDKDLPSGYNSGEQYDTLSTGYMSGEAYELPETRPEPLEPTLASIDEVSAKSNEDIFSLGQPPFLAAQAHGQPPFLAGQAEPVLCDGSSSSSSGSIPECVAVEMTGALDGLSILKNKRVKKTVSYHVSVPLDKSPLSNDGYREIPSDTDTTSCFDSDGTYIRSEGLSSDSGAALLSHARGRRGRKGGRGGGPGGGGQGHGRSVSLNRKLKKAKHMIRSHEDFFRIHDNKYWEYARQACFWTSILSILVSIGTAAVLIGLMPRSCDPETLWWQGGVVLSISPANTDQHPHLNITDLILNVPRYQELGVQAIKLTNLYRRNFNTNNTGSTGLNMSDWLQFSDDHLIRERLELEQVSVLSQTLHSYNMQLMVEIPAMETLSDDGMMSLFLIQNVTMAIKSWAEMGVDGIAIIGLEMFQHDPYIAITVQNWKIYFNKYSKSPYPRIMTASYQLPHNIEAATEEVTDDDTKKDSVTGYDSIASFELLEASLSLESLDQLEEAVSDIARWDRAPSQPWILWNIDLVSGLDHAELALNMLLPGTISVRLEDLDTGLLELLTKLIQIRRSSVPIFMNGNYKTCHAHCDHTLEKVDNYKVSLHEDNNLLLLERNFNRRNRYMVIANNGDYNISLAHVSSLYSTGEVILDTTDLSKQPEFIKFKEESLSGHQALVIKFPK